MMKRAGKKADLTQPVWRCQQVRDLVAVMAMPGLIEHTAANYRGRVVDDAWCRGCYQIALAKLEQLDFNPAPLAQWIAARKTERLGSYFETLIEYWLTELLGYQLVARNHVISQERRQLGEFDFLFRQHRDAALVHWEVTVKFYLWFDGEFIGPNVRDRLQRKLTHVFDRQLRLSEPQQVREQLKLVQINDEIIPKAFIKGRLFYPVESEWQTVRVAEDLSPLHERGWWCRSSDVNDWLSTRDSNRRWVVLPRMKWLASYYCETEEGLQTSIALAEMVADHFESGGPSLMVAELVHQDEGWHELTRGVIVSDSWPVMRRNR